MKSNSGQWTLVAVVVSTVCLLAGVWTGVEKSLQLLNLSKDILQLPSDLDPDLRLRRAKFDNPGLSKDQEIQLHNQFEKDVDKYIENPR